MLTYSAVGTGAEAAAYLADFQSKTGAEELITVHYADSVDNRVRSVEILAEATQLERHPRRGLALQNSPASRAGGRRLRRASRG